MPTKQFNKQRYRHHITYTKIIYIYIYEEHYRFDFFDLLFVTPMAAPSVGCEPEKSAWLCSWLQFTNIHIYGRVRQQSFETVYIVCTLFLKSVLTLMFIYTEISLRIYKCVGKCTAFQHNTDKCTILYRHVGRKCIAFKQSTDKCTFLLYTYVSENAFIQTKHGQTHHTRKSEITRPYMSYD